MLGVGYGSVTRRLTTYTRHIWHELTDSMKGKMTTGH